MSIPVPLRPRDAPIPLTNLSTGENGRLDRIHRETEGRPPSERMADAYFADEFMRVSPGIHLSLNSGRVLICLGVDTKT